MAPRDRAAAALIALAALLPVSQAGLAHGYAGDRYFPPTIDIDDPFAAAESHVHAGKRPGDPERSSVIGAGFGLEPVDGFGIGLDTAHRSPNPNLSPAKDGFDNAILTLKKELVIDDAHEYAITAALVTEVGGTGSEGASGHSTFAPTLFYAKGFGDLPDRLRLLRPFAVTGVLAAELPTDAARPKMLNWGFTVQYSLLYLQSHVGAFGLSAPFDRLVAVVEFPVKTCLDRGCSGQTSGTWNPGVVWVGKGFNLAFEAVQPLNSRSGSGTGFLVQFQKFFAQ